MKPGTVAQAIVSALRMQGQLDLCEFEKPALHTKSQASQDYTMRLLLKIK